MKEIKAAENLANGKLPPCRKGKRYDDEEGSENGDVDELEDGNEEVVMPAAIAVSPSAVQQSDSDEPVTSDEDHKLLVEVNSGICSDAEEGFLEVRKLNKNGVATPKQLYEKFTDVFETRFAGCADDIPLMQHFKVFYFCTMFRMNP